MGLRTDQELIRAYTDQGSDAAFAELVRRYVDLVYSCALRFVRDGRTAEDVSQATFLALARGAKGLKDRESVAGWLHRTTHNLAVNTVRSESRRRAREQEAAMMTDLGSDPSAEAWASMGPELDAAIGELDESEKEAVLLRYFQRKSAREMAAELGTSEDAAQKRLTRAVEHLRDLLRRRGVTVAASVMVLAISTHAVQAAPPALAGTISVAAASLGAAVFSGATAVTIKTIAMTTIQKTIVTAVIVTSIAFGVHEATKVSSLSRQVENIQAQQAATLVDTTAEIQSLSNSASDAASRVESLKIENARLQKLASVYPVSLSRTSPFPPFRGPGGVLPNGAIENVARLKEYLKQNPARSIPEMQFVSDQKWLDAVRGFTSPLETDEDFGKAISTLTRVAKYDFAHRLSWALSSYAKEHEDKLPTDVLQLKDYLNKQVNRGEGPSFAEAKKFEPVDDALLQNYQLLQSGTAVGLDPQQGLIKERTSLNNGAHSGLEIGLGGSIEYTAEGKQTGNSTWTSTYNPASNKSANETADAAAARGAQMMLEAKMAYLTNVLSADQAQAYRSKKLEELQKANEAQALLHSFGQ